MSFVHFKGQFSMRTACGRSAKMKSQTSERMSDVTCPKCQDAVTRRREADKDLGNYTIKDDMIGTARIRREARLPKGVFEHTPEAAIVALCSEPKKWGDVLAAIKDPANAKKFWEFAQASNEELKAWVMGMVKQRQLAIVAGETGTLIVAPGGSSIPGRKKMMGPRENVQHVTLGYLKQLIEKSLKKPSKKPVSVKKTSPASLLKQITDALATLGYKVGSREKNSGSLKAWLDPVGGKPKPVYHDDDYLGSMQKEPTAPTPAPSPGRIAMKYKKALAAAGLPTTVTGDRYETVLRGKGFDVILAPEGGGDIGAAIFVQVFAGKHADLERSGFDTSDLRFGEGTIRENIEKPSNELERLIATMGPDEVADDDYVDTETGEIYLEKGRKARTSQMHPQYTRDHQEKRAAQQQAWADEEAQWAKEDEEWENEKARARKEAEDAWNAALNEYAGNWTDFQASMGDEYSEDYAQSAAMDAAGGFFYQFPEWKRWAAELDMEKADMQSAIADFVYEAITTGRVPS